MGRHVPGILWALKRIGHYPTIHLTTVDSKNIKLACYSPDGDGFSLEISRRDARLLAKRLNQILDDTV